MEQKLLDLAEVLRARGFAVSLFERGADAADYLDRAIDGKTVGFGGSVTLRDLGLYERLGRHNKVYAHMFNGPSELPDEMAAQDFLCSVNAAAQTGELVNIDGRGNRIASTVYGHEKVWLVIGRNKLVPTLEDAIFRARNIAAPKNAQRLEKKTPCAARADRCYDCASPDRICRAVTICLAPMIGMETEVVLVDEDLGY